MAVRVHPHARERMEERGATLQEVEAIRISDELIIDIAPDGRLYGIEFLNANEQLQSEQDTSRNKLLVVNEATGEEVGVFLPT